MTDIRLTKFFSVFSKSVQDEILGFCKRISSTKADVYIFLARKAAVFCDCLEELGQIHLDGYVTTDRSLDIDGKWLKGKDVVTVINIVYIDDEPQLKLSEYLEGPFGSDYTIDSQEVIFSPDAGYKSLLVDPKVKEANIAIIDSKLFENRSSHDGFFTGEEFLVVLKKLFPFIETIIVSQNDLIPGLDYVKKYEHSDELSAKEYYDCVLKDRIKSAIDNIRRYRYLADIVKDNDSWDTFLKDKVLRTLDGYDEYDDLKKADLDEIITAFKQIQEALDND